MDDKPIAESLPERYRQLLDRVAEVSKAGFRTEADLMRAAAIRAYSRRWNNATDRRLQELIRRGDRVLDRDRSRRHLRRGGVRGFVGQLGFALHLPVTRHPSSSVATTAATSATSSTSGRETTTA